MSYQIFILFYLIFLLWPYRKMTPPPSWQQVGIFVIAAFLWPLLVISWMADWGWLGLRAKLQVRPLLTKYKLRGGQA